jgi:hypothetical protein
LRLLIFNLDGKIIEENEPVRWSNCVLNKEKNTPPLANQNEVILPFML